MVGGIAPDAAASRNLNAFCQYASCPVQLEHRSVACITGQTRYFGHFLLSRNRRQCRCRTKGHVANMQGHVGMMLALAPKPNNRASFFYTTIPTKCFQRRWTPIGGFASSNSRPSTMSHFVVSSPHGLSS